MELFITKNGHIIARMNDESRGTDEYALHIEETLPEAPTEDAGRGKEWEVDYVDGVLVWVAKDRPLTQEERLEKVEEDIKEQKYAWKTGEDVSVGDERFYKGVWYACIQAHITQDGWTPDIVPALWEMKK